MKDSSGICRVILCPSPSLAESSRSSVVSYLRVSRLQYDRCIPSADRAAVRKSLSGLQRFGRALLRINQNLVLVVKERTLVEPESEIGLEPG